MEIYIKADKDGMCASCRWHQYQYHYYILLNVLIDRISRHTCGLEVLQFGKLEIALLLLADNGILLASSVCDLFSTHWIGCEAVGRRALGSCFWVSELSSLRWLKLELTCFTTLLCQKIRWTRRQISWSTGQSLNLFSLMVMKGGVMTERSR